MFVLHETWNTILFGIYYCVQVVRIEDHSDAVNYVLSCDFIGFLSFFGTFVHKIAQTWFVLHETWHTTLFGIYYCVEVV